MEPILRHDYWGATEARAAFKKFILEIHGLDFTEWEARGYWDAAYRPFSLFHGDEIVSSVCLYELDAWLDGIYLFADEEAIPFYESTGFRALDDSLEFVEPAPVRRRKGARRLDPAGKGDLDRIFDYAQGRAPVSDRFSVLSPKLLMFHVLTLLRDAVWEIPALGCLVLARRGVRLLEEAHCFVWGDFPVARPVFPFTSRA